MKHHDAPDDARLDALLELDRPEPGPEFDRRFFARLDALADGDGDDEARLDALLDPVVGADRPQPGPAFDARVLAALTDPRPPTAGGRILAFARRPALVAPLLAAAAALAIWVGTRPPAEPPPADVALLGHIELLEVYDELEVLDGIADEETFELVAMLHTLDGEEARP